MQLGCLVETTSLKHTQNPEDIIDLIKTIKLAWTIIQSTEI